MPARDFDTIVKEMTASSVHVPVPLTTEKPRDKVQAKSFVELITEAGKPAKVAKRTLQPNTDGETAKSPFIYDPNVLSTIRPDQVPKLFGALTDSEKLPKTNVPLGELHAMQDRVDPTKVQAIADNGVGGGKLPVVIRHDGKNYIADGHHRLSADWLNGAETSDVRFKDLEPVDHALKGAGGMALFHDLLAQAHKRAEAETLPSVNVAIAKVSDELGVVFGWAIICKQDGKDYYDLNVDQAGAHAGKRVPENIVEACMAKAALDFALGNRPGNEMHAGPDSGIYPFVMPMTSDLAKAFGFTTATTGLMVGYKPEPAVFAKFKSGEFTGFSIEGRRLHFLEATA